MMLYMTTVIVRVHFIHLMNVEQHRAAVDPHVKPTNLVHESACTLLSSTLTLTIYYYSVCEIPCQER